MLVSDLAVDSLNMSLKVCAVPEGRHRTVFDRAVVLPFVYRAVVFAACVSFGFKGA